MLYEYILIFTFCILFSTPFFAASCCLLISSLVLFSIYCLTTFLLSVASLQPQSYHAWILTFRLYRYIYNFVLPPLYPLLLLSILHRCCRVVICLISFFSFSPQATTAINSLSSSQYRTLLYRGI